MKKLLLILLIFPVSIYSQDIDVKLESNTKIIVEDKSVEAAREKAKLMSQAERNKRIRRARNARLSKWKKKKMHNENISFYKYVMLMPPEVNEKKIRKRLIKNWPTNLPEYVNVGGSFKTHKSIPKEMNTNPEKVLYMYVDTKRSNITTGENSALANALFFDTYIQLYDYNSKLIYANGTFNNYYFKAINKLIEDFEFAYQFSNSSNKSNNSEMNNEDYIEKGYAAFKNKDYKAAIADFSTAIELKPDNDKAYAARAVPKRTLKDYKGAIADITKAIELKPNNALYYNMRATTKRRSGDPKGAIEDYNKALTIDPNNARNIGGRGTAKSNLNDLDGACADWNKAVATAGDDEGAKKTYQAKIDENCITKEKAIKELKELKELLDMDLITKDEYDKKATELKKVILGN